MVTASARWLAKQGRVITPDEFLQSLQSVCSKWHRPMPERIGIAVSGGVDSMALAGLCAGAAHLDCSLHVTAFIVDHKLRAESAREAMLVKHNLQAMGINSEILTVPEQQRITDDLHIERRAREFRYGLLGSAYRDHHIDALLVAHHSDDQAETVLTRIINLYTGLGLRGIQAVANMHLTIPLYGISQSGQPRRISARHSPPQIRSPVSRPIKSSNVSGMLTEAGGINLIRPLLQYTKADMIATCTAAHIPWIEDQTNKDVSLTTRNTLRYMNDNELLPRALRAPRLSELSATIEARRDRHSALIEEAISQAEILIDTSWPRITCTFPTTVVRKVQSYQAADHIRASLLQELLSLVDYREKTNMNQLSHGTTVFLQSGQEVMSYQKGAVQMTGKLEQDGAHKYEFTLTTPNRYSSKASLTAWDHGSSTIVNRVRWSNWQLWEGRYWVRLGYHTDRRDGLPHTVVRYRRPSDELETNPEQHTLRKQFSKHKKAHKIRESERYAIPVIATGVDSEVVAYPSLGLSTRDWAAMEDEEEEPSPSADYYYMIRYKEIPAWATEPLESNSE